MREHQFVTPPTPIGTTRSKRAMTQRQWQTFTIHHWADPLVVKLGHSMDSRYVERFWLPLIGPTSWCMARNLLSGPSEGLVQLDQLGSELGCNEVTAMRTLVRLERFQILKKVGPSVFIRTHLPPLTMGQHLNLPPHLRLQLIDEI